MSLPKVFVNFNNWDFNFVTSRGLTEASILLKTLKLLTELPSLVLKALDLIEVDMWHFQYSFGTTSLTASIGTRWERK